MNQDLLDLDSAEFALRESFFLIERTQNFIALYYGSVGGWELNANRSFRFVRTLALFCATFTN